MRFSVQKKCDALAAVSHYIYHINLIMCPKYDTYSVREAQPQMDDFNLDILPFSKFEGLTFERIFYV